LGPNGAGKSTLIKVLAGEIQPLNGKMEPAKDFQPGYFAQHQLEQLNRYESPLQHLKRIDRDVTERDLRNFLGGFAFTGDLALEPVAQRSGGEKARLVLAMLAYQRPNLLLLDEPTNHLDIQVRDALSIALQDYMGALVIVSHDRHLLRTITDRFILVNRGRLRPFDGDLDDYRNSLRQNAEIQPDNAPPANDSRRNQRRVEAEQRKQLRTLRGTLEKCESDLEKLQNRCHELEGTLSDAELYAADRREKLKALLREKSNLDRNILESEEIWMRALQELEEAENSVGQTIQH
jgi:ATP-binding cassette subfamily F protein 3